MRSKLDLASLPDCLVLVAPIAEIIAVGQEQVSQLIQQSPPELSDLLRDASASLPEIRRWLGQSLRIPKPDLASVASRWHKMQRQYKLFDAVEQSKEYHAFARLVEAISLIDVK
jgi:hypothetical protein